MKLLYIIILSFVCLSLSAQEKLNFGDTENTAPKSPTYKANDKQYKKRKPVELIKTSSKGLLLGNPCMEEIYKELELRYTIQRKEFTGKPNSNYVNGFYRFFKNFGAKVKLLLRNGPFWKFKLNKKRKQCRELAGDYVG